MPKRSKVKRSPIGFFHIDIAGDQTAEGPLFLFVGIDRTNKFAVTQRAEQPRNRTTEHARPMRFDMICEESGFEHRLAKPNHPWIKGQVEWMNRTIQEASVKRFHYDSHDQLRTHLSDLMAACNFARRLKTLNGPIPYEYICKIRAAVPERFIPDPIHQMPGLTTQNGWLSSVRPGLGNGAHHKA